MPCPRAHGRRGRGPSRLPRDRLRRGRSGSSAGWGSSCWPWSRCWPKTWGATRPGGGRGGRPGLGRGGGGTLEPEQVERLGSAFERLEQEMLELKERFALDDDDLA